MKNEKIAAFTYVEMLMVLLVTMIIIVVSAPMITKKAKKPPSSAQGGGAPIGSIVIWPSNANPPFGWVECDGRDISTEGYNKLRMVLQGANNIPDMRGVFLVKAPGQQVNYNNANYDALEQMAGDDPNARSLVSSARNQNIAIPELVEVRWIIRVE